MNNVSLDTFYQGSFNESNMRAMVPGRLWAPVNRQQHHTAYTLENLWEAYHLLKAKADVNYWIGKALHALGRDAEAAECFEASASERWDFQAMAVTEHSEFSYFRGLSLIKLGRTAEAKALFEDLKSYAEREHSIKSEIDYFATSLPLLLVFEDDLDRCW